MLGVLGVLGRQGRLDDFRRATSGPNRQEYESSSSFGLKRHRPMKARRARQGGRCHAAKVDRMMASF